MLQADLMKGFVVFSLLNCQGFLDMEKRVCGYFVCVVRCVCVCVCSFPKSCSSPLWSSSDLQCIEMEQTHGKGTGTLFSVSQWNGLLSRIKIIAFVTSCNLSTQKNAFKHIEILNCCILVSFHMGYFYKGSLNCFLMFLVYAYVNLQMDEEFLMGF